MCGGGERGEREGGGRKEEPESSHPTPPNRPRCYTKSPMHNIDQFCCHGNNCKFINLWGTICDVTRQFSACDGVHVVHAW